MNLNLVVIAGHLAVAPEIIHGTNEVARLLVTVRSGEPDDRVDLLPVVAPIGTLPEGLATGVSLWVAGSLQRRFSPRTGRSRLEVVAGQVQHKVD